jgi:hypothetical protein
MPTHLFVVRLWREELSQSSDEWRGRVVAVETGEERAFRDPATLYDALLRILTHMDENRQPKGWDENPPIVPTADDPNVDRP